VIIPATIPFSMLAGVACVAAGVGSLIALKGELTLLRCL
jgi:hypothetical protein